MTKKELANMVIEMETLDLVKWVETKTGLSEQGAHTYVLSLFWNLSDDKLKNEIVEIIEENN
jgi:hypothetical protein